MKNDDPPRSRRAVVVTLSAVVVVLVSACAARRTPLYAADDLAARGIERIVVAPVTDERAFSESQVPLGQHGCQLVTRELMRKGYDVSPRCEAGAAVRPERPLLDANAEMPRSATADAHAEEAPSYTFFVGLERARTESSGHGLDAFVRIGAVLADEEGNIVWKDRAAAESSISGAGLGAINPAVRLYEALALAVARLLETLPDKR